MSHTDAACQDVALRESIATTLAGNDPPASLHSDIMIFM
jgi:hypothetical protein